MCGLWDGADEHAEKRAGHPKVSAHPGVPQVPHRVRALLAGDTVLLRPIRPNGWFVWVHIFYVLWGSGASPKTLMLST